MSLDLTPLLDQLAESSRERGGDASVATMTIVVFFENTAIGELARERIRLLASKHPSRVIVLDGDQTQQSFRVESSDWVELGVKGSAAEVLRSAVSALRLPDVPVVLTWIAPGIGEDLRFEALCENAQTVVYNSSLVDSGNAALCELVDYVDAHPELPLADIAYLRLAPWQESIAIFFDGAAAAELTELEHIEIVCGSEPEAFYLLGWLASRLGWSPASADSLVGRAGKRIAYEIRREGHPRRIFRVELGSASSTFVAELDKDEETILLSVSGSSRHAPRYRRIDNLGIPALVERAILWGRNDRIFQAALAAAGAILAQRKD
ncbi:MAG TPA: glucose-6-phosphate dehydrogenase assembly protein OpcA [Candidatus Nitrosotalea sp.]|nr:glucose-6-phosphate dehydrogenase assembly protein OpcA [Candidatus Nitrosotalea sp.]